MSRFDSDADYRDDREGPYRDCEDCGRATDSHLCDACADRRDAHTDLMELKSMAKAVLRIDPATIKDVA